MLSTVHALKLGEVSSLDADGNNKRGAERFILKLNPCSAVNFNTQTLFSVVSHHPKPS